MTEFSRRRAEIAARLEEQKVDALLVAGLPNVRYLSGFTGSNALLLLTRQSSTLFTDPRYTIQAGLESDCPVRTAKGSLRTAVMKAVARRRIRRLGLERERMLLSGWLDLKEANKSVRLVALPPVVEQLRMVKSPEEIEFITRSVLTNSGAFDRVVRRLSTSASESSLAAEIEYQQRKLGAEGRAFESIVASGPRSALPHARPTGEIVGSNRLLLIDIGALQSGYCSDMTRVVHLGTPGRKARKLYDAVLEAQLAALDAVKAGTTCSTVDKAARQVLKKFSLSESFIHSTGHGLGLEIHEIPRVGAKDKTRLEAGMVITIEPGAYIEGFGGVRIEDTVVVTPNGCRVLTPTSKELVVV